METYIDSIRNSTIDMLDAKLLLAYIVGIKSNDVLLHGDRLLTDQQANSFEILVARRKAGEPIDLILGSRGFYLGEFIVTKDVLSPRPDTECIIEGVLKHAPLDSDILDLGTGSGCIIISLLMDLKSANGVGVDISNSALIVASQNAVNNGVDSRVNFINSNWFDAVVGLYDVIVSNPPYIPTADIDGLDVDVKQFDPMLALDGGTTGLKPYHILASDSKKYLKMDSIVAVEFGINQARLVQGIFEESGFLCIDSMFDLIGVERGLVFKLK